MHLASASHAAMSAPPLRLAKSGAPLRGLSERSRRHVSLRSSDESKTDVETPSSSTSAAGGFPFKPIAALSSVGLLEVRFP